MNTILVVSDEPALAATLESELPGVAVVGTRPAEAQERLSSKTFGLVLLDEGVSLNSLAEKTAVLRLRRPVVLNALLYTIHERLQGKSAPGREDMPLAQGLIFSPPERQLKTADGDIIPLTQKETQLLSCLLEPAIGKVTREHLLKRVWGLNAGIDTHTLETHIYRLRGKLRQAHESLDILFSEEGGYRLQR